MPKLKDYISDIENGTGQIPPWQVESVERAADALARGFSWYQSPEGYHFWDTIHTRLCSIAQGLKAKAEMPRKFYCSYCNDMYEVPTFWGPEYCSNCIESYTPPKKDNLS